MVEVFKTNVTDLNDASMIADAIRDAFDGYKANFDLHDCDNILRVQSQSGHVDPAPVISLLKFLGFSAEVLPDEVPPFRGAVIRPRELA